MQSFCFSSAPILRCQSLSSLQSEFLIIPTALEFIISNSLVIIFWRSSSWKHFFLVAEGWMYLALVLVDSLSGIIPAVRDDVAAASIIDTTIASMSFLPILFYLSFLFFFMRADFIVALPTKFQRPTRRLLVLCIPLITALNEIASFVGISRHASPNGHAKALSLELTNVIDQRLWIFFTSFTLATLTAFQAITFCIAFYRLVKVFVDQRNIETSSIDAVHLVKGTGWITAGLKTGAIETVIGFAQCGFGGTLTRRVLRLFSRTFIVIGMIKGIDAIEDFKWLKNGGQNLNQKGRPSSSLREIIADPRFNTFKRVSQVRADLRTLAPIKLTPNDMDKKPKQRVTILRENGQAPTLQMRFSYLDLPTPSIMEETLNSRSAFDRALPSAGMVLPSPGATRSSASLLMRRSSISDLTPQFPSLPQHAKVQDSYENLWNRHRMGPNTASSKISPYPMSPLSPVPSVSSLSDGSGTVTPSIVSLGKRISVSRDTGIAPGFPMPSNGRGATYVDAEQSFISLTRSNTEMTNPPLTPIHARTSNDLSSGSARISYSTSDFWTEEGQIPVQDDIESQFQNDFPEPSSLEGDVVSAQVQGHAGSGEVDWQRPRDKADRERTPSGNLIIRKSDWVRFKAVGNVPRKYTHIPTPIRSTRASVVVEQMSPSSQDTIMFGGAPVNYNRPTAF